MEITSIKWPPKDFIIRIFSTVAIANDHTMGTVLEFIKFQVTKCP
jgi:hypothetical protein